MITDLESLKKFPFTLTKKEVLPKCSTERCRYKPIIYCTHANKVLCKKCLNVYHKNNLVTAENQFYRRQTCGIRFLCLCKRDLKIFEICFQYGGNCNKEMGNRHVILTHDLLMHSPTIKSIKLFEKYGADLQKSNRNKESCFHAYCSSPDVNEKVFNYLLKKGVDLLQLNVSGRGAFQNYLNHPNIKIPIIRIFLQQPKFDINLTDHQDETVLFALRSSKQLSFEVTKLLIDSGINVDHCNHRNQTALHALCQSGNPECELMKLMVDHSKKILVADSQGNTAFHYYLKFNSDPQIIKYFLAKGETLSGHQYAQRQTALHCLFKQHGLTLEKIQFYLEQKHKLNLDQKDIANSTPLHLLCEGAVSNPSQLLEILQWIKKSHNFDFNQINNKGKTCLMNYLKHNTNPEIIEFLLKNCKDVNHSDSEGGNTLLHLITSSFHLQASDDLCSLLFKYGANPNQPNDNLSTPFHVLIRRKVNLKLIKLFLVNGADASLKDEIKFHKFFVEWRVQKPIEFIKKQLQEFNKDDIYEFFVWVYSGKLPKNFLSVKEGGKNANVENQIENENLKNIFQKFEIELNNEKNKFKESLKNLFRDEKSKDFSLVINETNEKIKVHRIILQCRSKLFNNMFESIQDPDIDHVTDYSKRTKESLQILIEYLYTEKIDSKKLNRKIKSQLSDSVDYYQLIPNCSFNFYLGNL
ncbi:ankyrin repeat-containing protein [Anaeramoeba flamelloides]|uniref:Ankyrin repeat-containing protein n=1 Tax=Anaeramoeba flamelloides TaxID=1746091 RepID=A0ABQ8XD50_9EUKA|nr:ankyrin repeat-containing protein [Anaeramoeba flamelloides]